jgi:hypothetical protein
MEIRRSAILKILERSNLLFDGPLIKLSLKLERWPTATLHVEKKTTSCHRIHCAS